MNFFDTPGTPCSASIVNEKKVVSDPAVCTLGLIEDGDLKASLSQDLARVRERMKCKL